MPSDPYPRRGLSRASDLLPDFLSETAAAIRQRLADHPEVTHLHGARLISEDEIVQLENRAKELRRGVRV
jgi:hypothetical protein